MSFLDTTSAAGGAILDPIAAGIKNPFSTTVKNNGERGADFPSGFIITEYVNGIPQVATQLRLIGNMMPMRPFPWETEQRIVKDYYPGNPEPAVQILGGKEGDLTIHGRLKDKRYKDNKYYGLALQIAEALDAIRKRGNLLRFGMSGEGGKWFRYGFIEKCSFKMDKVSWVDYDITFIVVSETQPKNNYFASQDKNPPDSFNATLINDAASFQENYSAVPSSMPLSIAGLMNNIINGVAKNVNLVTGFISNIITTAQDIEASAKRAIGLIKNVRIQIAIYKRQVGAITSDFSHLSSSGNPVGQFRDAYHNSGYLLETMAGMHVLSLGLSKLQAQFEAIAATIPIARYKVQVNDTLQNISIRFYGISDNWELILKHNNLTSTVLTPGQILEIPRA